MAFCANCGSPVEGDACPLCGAAAAPADRPAAALGENVASALCYFFIVAGGVLFLLLAPYNRSQKIRFHACQSILLGVVFMSIWFVFSLVSLALHLMGIFFVLRLSSLIGLAFLVVWVYMIGNAFQGRDVLLPVLGPMAKKQAK
jgi:uncharacterized membrane protein